MKKTQEMMPILKCWECGENLHFCEQCQAYHCDNSNCIRYDEDAWNPE